MTDDAARSTQQDALANLLGAAGPVDGAVARPPALRSSAPPTGPEPQATTSPPARRGRVRLLLADDHAIFLAGLNAFFDGQPGVDVLAHARDGDEAVALASELQPDVVLLDLTMPGVDGVEATRRIRGQIEKARVLILSRHATAADVRRAFREGASGYLLKGSSPADLVRAIRALADHETFLCPKAASLLMANAFEGEGGTQVASGFASLSTREREVLQRIAEGGSSKEIAAALRLSVKTVETHRARLMRKLDLHSVAALTKCAVREGITSLDT